MNVTEKFELKIRFNHDFKKLHRQTKARLVFLTVVDADSLHQDFKQYETLYFNGSFDAKNHPIPSAGRVLLLYFVGNKMIPFCAARPHTYDRESFFKHNLGRIFNVYCRQKSFYSENGSQSHSDDNPDQCFFLNPSNNACNCSNEHVNICSNMQNCRSFLPDIEEIRSIMPHSPKS